MQKSILFSLSFLFFVWWIGDVFLKTYYDSGYVFLWFCSIGLLWLSVALFADSPGMVVAFLSMAIIGQGIWLIDISSYLVFGFYVTGNTSYLVDGSLNIWEFLHAFRHFVMIPVGFLYLSYTSKPIENQYFWGIVITTGIALVSGVVTSVENNINCVLRPCWESNGFNVVYIPLYYIFFLLVVGYVMPRILTLVFEKSNQNILCRGIWLLSVLFVIYGVVLWYILLPYIF